MSIALLQSEIRRFLGSETPEVLCIRGKWGIGKTYAWIKYLGEAQAARELTFSQYAYISLFGLNSLNDLRYAIFESTVATEQYLTGPDISTLGSLLAKGMDWGRKNRPFLDSIAGVLGRKDAGEALSKASFLLVRRQIICFDDLERAGEGLKQRDILGLASFLKEQRKCKIVLLLNDEEMEDAQRKEFDRQLEKVVDINLRFDPSSEEAVEIAFNGPNPILPKLRQLATQLGIVNIRVLKKIERLANLLQFKLSSFDDCVLDSAIMTVVLAGWSVFQPQLAPSVAFLQTFGSDSLAIRAADGKLSEDEEKWFGLLKDYGYVATGKLDKLILDGVVRGAFDDESLLNAARELHAQLIAGSRENSFSEAWNAFHGDLSVDDDQILDNIRQGALENLTIISVASMNGTVRLLREQGRNEQASDLIEKYVDANRGNQGFFNPDNIYLARDDVFDPPFAEAISAARAAYIDDRDPREVLVSMFERKGWDPEDIELLAKVTADQFQAIFESIRGADLRRSIKNAQLIGRQGDEASAKVGIAVQQALEQIARKSPLRALRLRRYGIDVSNLKA